MIKPKFKVPTEKNTECDKCIHRIMCNPYKDKFCLNYVFEIFERGCFGCLHRKDRKERPCFVCKHFKEE